MSKKTKQKEVIKTLDNVRYYVKITTTEEFVENFESFKYEYVAEFDDNGVKRTKLLNTEYSHFTNRPELSVSMLDNKYLHYETFTFDKPTIFEEFLTSQPANEVFRARVKSSKTKVKSNDINHFRVIERASTFPLPPFFKKGEWVDCGNGIYKQLELTAIKVITHSEIIPIKKLKCVVEIIGDGITNIMEQEEKV
jgi:hypothetical protein